MARYVFALLLILVVSVPAAAQNPSALAPELPSAAEPETDAPGSLAGTVKVFLDCKDHTPCFYDYVKTEIAYVDYVNVREAADVHVLVTSLGTTAGGREFTFTFVGLGEFAGMDDAVLHTSLPTDTEELVRRGFVRVLKLGLVRYALHTGVGTELSVTHRPGEPRRPAQDGSRSGRDPWNAWVFRTRFNMSKDSESTNDAQSYSGSVSAGRTTHAWKIGVSAFNQYSENYYLFSDGESYTSIRRSWDAGGMAIKSLGPHWAAGVRSRLSSSSYENKDLVAHAGVAVEYNLFPYAESSTRQLTLMYSAGVSSTDYSEETVFGKLNETVGSHLARASFDLKRTWGSLSSDLEYHQYMHDASLNRKSASVEADVRLFRGFSINLFARTSRIHDQLYLAKGEATDEEVLARQRQLATSYRHSLRVGLSYTFGSVFSNIVNTRLSSSF